MGCPTDDWQKFDRNCYYISSTTVNWDNAKENCRSLGGHLAVPTSLENNKHIKEAMKKRNIPTVWIGVQRVGEKFYTIHGGEITFTIWDNGEPSSGAEYCVELMYTPLLRRHDDVGGRWNDATCSSANRYYICQLSV